VAEHPVVFKPGGIMRAMLCRTVAALGLPVVSGCAASASETSPWQGSIDLRVAPGFAAGGSERVTLHPTVAYARSVVGGVEGERDDVLHFGGQLRARTARRPAGVSSFWFGGEATYARRRTAFDAPGVDAETTNGWTLAALGGSPLIDGTAATVHGYVAAGVVKFGGAGPYLRVGLDVQPAFLRR
jgi:hypothetical protein